MNSNPNIRRRGIAAVYAESHGNLDHVLNELNTTFASFRARNDSRIDELTNMVNSQQETIQALRLGGVSSASVHPGAGIRRGGPGYSPITGGAAEDFHNQLRGMPSASMSTQSDPDGGYTVFPEVDGVLDAVVRDLSPLRSLARVVNLGAGKGDWEKIIGKSGAQSAWVGEEETRADTDNPTLGKVTIPAEEVYALPQMTNRLLDDSAFDLNAFLSEDVSGEFALVEGAAFVSGDGMKKPRGFLSYEVTTQDDAARAFGKLQYVASGHASSFASSNPADALHDLLTALRPSYRKGDGVAWLMNSATANVIRKFKDGQGNYLWTGSIVTGQPDRLLGYPVAIDEGMPDIGANKFPVAFGNWRRGYAIVDKPGLRLIVDRVTKKGWTKMFFYRRVGGGVVDSNAIKLLKIATS